jgi:WD40 repeat protein
MPRLNPFARGKARLTKLWEASLPDHVIGLAWSPQPGGLLAAAAVSGPITLLASSSGAVQHELAGHGFGTAAIAWSRDGAHFASAGQDGLARLWDHGRGRQVHEMQGGAAWVEHLAWCPVNDVLATAAGKKLRLWNAQGELLREHAGHTSTISALAWKPGAPVLASACYGKIMLWAPDQAEPVQSFEWKGSGLALAWSPDGRQLAAGSQDASVHFWLLDTGDDLQMSGYPTKVRELAWNPGSRYLATGGASVVCVWDCAGAGPAGRKPIQLEVHKDLVSALAYQRGGPLLASGSADGQVALWQPGQTQGALTLAQLGARCTQLAWSPDDRVLAAGSAEGKVVVFAHG